MGSFMEECCEVYYSIVVIQNPQRMLMVIIPTPIWEFPKIRGTLFWCPCNKDPTIWATILGCPIFGNSHISQPQAVNPTGFTVEARKLA